MKFLKEHDIYKADLPQENVDAAVARMEALRTNTGDEKVGVLRHELQDIMMHNVGVFRDADKLKVALNKVRELEERSKRIQLDDQGMHFNTDLSEAMELVNLLHFAELIVKGALQREESRGAQFRTDFPNRDDETWLKHTLAYKQDGQITFDFKPVVITKFQPQERKY